MTLQAMTTVSEARARAFYAFMLERETIRCKKEDGLPWPWTSDYVLQQYKFTNVKRSDDRTSRQLRDEFYAPNRLAPPDQLLFNAAVFRYFGTIEMAREIGWQQQPRPARMKQIAARRLANGDKVFTGAYLITNNGIKAPKQDVVVDHFLMHLWKNRKLVVKEAALEQCWYHLVKAMSLCDGFGGTGFMAKEVAMDLCFTTFWSSLVPSAWSYDFPRDRDTWCPAGPGARRGVQRLLGRSHKEAISEGKALEVMRELFAARVDLWPKEISVGSYTWQMPQLELHDVQFQLCEFDKYERTKNGDGTPRSRYIPPNKR